MATFTQSLMLDVAGRNRYKYVYAKQGDSGSRFVNVTMLANGIKIVPESGTTAKIRALKPDGTGVFNPATINDNGTITAALTSQMLAVKGDVQADIMLVGSNNEILSTVTFYIKVEEAPAGEAIESSNEFLELAKTAHTHDNKDTLDKFAETDGQPTYNGEPIGGENIMYITATVVDFSDGVATIETNVPFEQIDAAYRSGQEQILKLLFDDSGEEAYLLSLVFVSPGYVYYFGAIMSESVLIAMLYSDSANFVIRDLIDHTHNNKSVLDKLSIDYYGKLKYDGSDIELSPSQVTSGTSMTLANNTEYRLTDVTELTITYPDGNFDCWMRLTFAADGTITVTLPSTTQYIGTTPTFANGETWELSIKDGVVVAGEVA